MPVNPRATLLIKPGDPSDVYLISKRYMYQPGGAPEQMAQPDGHQLGDDVSNWHSVVFNLYGDPDTAAVWGIRAEVQVWRYYDSSTAFMFPGVAAGGQTASYTSRGNWIKGEFYDSLTLNGSQLRMPGFIAVPTYNCDRMYFQLVTLRPLSSGGSTSALDALCMSLYGLTPRSPDGTTPAVLGALTPPSSNSTSSAKVTVYSASAAGVALTYTMPNILVDFELVSVMFSLAAAPAAAGECIVTLDAALGATYDHVLFRGDPFVMGPIQYITYQPKTKLLFDAGDRIKVDYANPSAVNPVTVQIGICSPLSI